MNIKNRLKNKTFIVSTLAIIVGFVYQILGQFDVVAPISQNEVVNIINIIFTMLVALGVMVDPTTQGITDKPKETEEETE